MTDGGADWQEAMVTIQAWQLGEQGQQDQAQVLYRCCTGVTADKYLVASEGKSAGAVSTTWSSLEDHGLLTDVFWPIWTDLGFLFKKNSTELRVWK